MASLRHWIGVHAVPLVLVPLAGVLLGVAIWKIWLPTPDEGSPSRRSNTLTIALLVLGVGTAILGLMHDRIASLKASTTGFELTLTPEQQEGAQELVNQLAAKNAPASAYAEGLKRYVARLPKTKAAHAHAPAAAAAHTNGGGSTGDFKQLAQQIASDLAGG